MYEIKVEKAIIIILFAINALIIFKLGVYLGPYLSEKEIYQLSLSDFPTSSYDKSKLEEHFEMNFPFYPY